MGKVGRQLKIKRMKAETDRASLWAAAATW